MAQKQIGNSHGFVVIGGTSQSGGSDDKNMPADIGDVMQDLSGIEASLTAGNGTRYSAANLRRRTYNDKVFAVRREGFVSGTLNDFT